jgi:predicted TIM-barrel fold metal-dependent hydrolase
MLALCGIALIILSADAQSQARSAERLPIIDMHMHALWWGARLKEPATGFVGPESPDALQSQTIAEMNRWNIVKAVASGPKLDAYRAELGSRILPGVFMQGQPTTTPEALREMHRRGDLSVLAEFAPQYAGIAPNDERLEPYFALAEEVGIPIGIHMGPGPPGAAYVGAPDYRMQLSNALLLENVLVRHPKLRIYVMHAGWPLLDSMIGLLYAHPQVFVDIAVIDWVVPEAEFHTYLRRLVEAGYEKRIMFGSDNMMWPQSFQVAITRITSATYLTEEQKRAILCRNAATFLQLAQTTCGT